MAAGRWKTDDPTGYYVKVLVVIVNEDKEEEVLPARWAQDHFVSWSDDSPLKYTVQRWTYFPEP